MKYRWLAKSEKYMNAIVQIKNYQTNGTANMAKFQIIKPGKKPKKFKKEKYLVLALCPLSTFTNLCMILEKREDPPLASSFSLKLIGKI